MWKVYGDTFMIATRLEQPAAAEERARPARARRSGWLARAWRRMH
jgi:hypothetical protein